jgi:hypothetical protein
MEKESKEQALKIYRDLGRKNYTTIAVNENSKTEAMFKNIYSRFVLNSSEQKKN